MEEKNKKEENPWFKDCVDFDQLSLSIAVSGVITAFAPNKHPRNLDKIMDYVQKYAFEHVDEGGCTFSDGYYLYRNVSNPRKWIHDMLMGCLEYRQLNISERLWNEGVRDCDDDRNRGFGGCFVGHHDNGDITIYESKSYDDFIDLDACSDMIVHVLGEITV